MGYRTRLIAPPARQRRSRHPCWNPVAVFLVAVWAVCFAPCRDTATGSDDATATSAESQSGRKTATGVPSYAELKAAIAAAHKTRARLLANSTGTAHLTIERSEKTSGDASKLQKEFERDLNIPPGAMRFQGTGTWSVTWYKKGLKHRYDLNIPPPKEKALDSGRPFLIETNKRIAVDPEKGIYYDVLNNEAYIHRPPGGAGNPYDLVEYFRVSRLYKFVMKDLPHLMAFLEKEGTQPTLAEAWIGQTRCIKLEFRREKVFPGSKPGKYKWLDEFWLAPEMGYSLVKAQAFMNGPPTHDPGLLERYEASYAQSPKFPGVWLLKEVTILTRLGPLQEVLTARLPETQIGVEIPDETFTFRGLGVPKGTILYDKRSDPTARLVYDGTPVEELDGARPSLSAEEIPGNWEGNWRDDMGSTGRASAEVIAEEGGGYRALLTVHLGEAASAKAELRGKREGTKIWFQGRMNLGPGQEECECRGELEGRRFTGTWDPGADICFLMKKISKASEETKPSASNAKETARSPAGAGPL